MTTPVCTAAEFGLLNEILTVVDWPAFTVAAVTLGVVVVKDDPAIPISPTTVVLTGAVVEMDKLAA